MSKSSNMCNEKVSTNMSRCESGYISLRYSGANVVQGRPQQTGK
jgi:hypothetical protein